MKLMFDVSQSESSFLVKSYTMRWLLEPLGVAMEKFKGTWKVLRMYQGTNGTGVWLNKETFYWLKGIADRYKS